MLVVALVLGASAAATLLAIGFGRPAAGGPVCTKSWAAATSGDWSDGTKWSPAGAPASGDDVCVTVAGTYTVTVHQNVGANSLAVGATSGGGTATVVVEAVGCGGGFNTELHVSTTIDVNARGHLDESSTGCGGNYALLQAGGLVTVDGALSTSAGAGGIRYLRASVLNHGTLTLGANPTLEDSGGTLTNQGTVNVTGDWRAQGTTIVTNTSGSMISSGAGRLTVSGATFNEGGGATGGPNPVVIDGATLNLSGSGTAAHFTVHNSATLTGTLAASRSIDVEAAGCGGGFNTEAHVSGAFTNAGTITLTSTGCGGNYALLSANAPFTNSGTFTSAAGAGGLRYLRADVINTGTIATDTLTHYDQGSTTLTNQGTIDLLAGAQLQLSASRLRNLAGGSVTSVGTGQLVSTPGSTFEQGAGTTSGSQPVLIDGAALQFSGPGNGSFVVHNSASLSGDVPAGDQVTIEALGCGGGFNTALTGAGSFTNAGSISLTSSGCGGNYALFQTSGTVTNDGTISSLAGAGGPRYLRASVLNHGTLAVSQPLSYDLGGSVLTNTGSITASDVLMGAGATRIANLAGSVSASGAGRVQVSGGTVFEQGGGSVTGNPVAVESSGLAFSGAGTGSFLVHGSSALAGDVPSGAVVTVEAVGCGGGFNTSLFGSGPFTNAGSISLTSTGCGGNYALFQTAGTITNDGTITSAAGAGGARYLRASVLNHGTLSVASDLNYDLSGAVLTNTGTVSATHVLAASGSTRIRNLGGTVSASGSGVALVSGGAVFEQGNGAVTGNRVAVESSGLEFTGTGPGPFVMHGSSVLAGDVPSGDVVTLEALGCGGGFNTSVFAGASFVNAGSISLTSSGCGGNYALLQLAGTITNDGAISSDAGSGGARYLRTSVLNHGTLTVSQGLNYDQGGAVLTNQGTVSVTQALAASGATRIRNLAGTISASGPGVVLVSGGAVFEQGDGATAGNRVAVESSALEFSGSGSASIVMHGSSSLAGTVPAAAHVDLEALGCGGGFNTSVSTATPLTNAGSITLTSAGCGGNYAQLIVSGAFTNTGTFTVAPGAGGARYLSASTFDDHGTLSLLSGAPLQLTGSLVNEPDGTLRVAVDAAGVNGRVDASGSATFGGTLRTDTTFTPAFGDTFQVATYASTGGTFATMDAHGTQYTAQYGATSLTLAVLKVSGATLSATPAGATVAGEPVTFDAQVVAVAPATGTPTGTVTFHEGLIVLGTAALDGTGHAAFITAALNPGTHDVVATYGGDAQFGHSDSSIVTRTVTTAATTTALGSAPNPSMPGQDAVFTATVAVVAPGSGPITGSVTFTEGATTLASVPVDASGQAVFTTHALSIGHHSVVAGYVGDPRLAPSTSTAVDQNVAGVSRPTATVLGPLSSVPVATEPVTLSASVAPQTGSGVPSGTVVFNDGPTPLGQAVLDGSGVARLLVPSGFRAGSHDLQAQYGGDPAFDASTSPVLTTGVGQANATVAVTARVSADPKGSVVFDVVVSPAAPATGLPDGVVVLTDGTQTLGQAQLGAGKTTFVQCFTSSCTIPVTTTTTSSTTTTIPTTTSSTTTSTSTTSTTTTSTTTTSTTTTTTTTTIPTTTTTRRGAPTTGAGTTPP
ncbi:MAG: hypothetical protein JWN46_820, partial [Acidimicrobiales bacterium]|nr:hypothetical protein [Acidimicrobiales bacterium]